MSMYTEVNPKSLTRERVKAILDLVSKSTEVLVMGDIIVDHYVHGDVTRISPEAPVPILKFSLENFKPGGAGNVAINTRSLGAKTTLVGLMSDQATQCLAPDLEKAGISLDITSSATTPTKTRFIADGRHPLLRVDQETTYPISHPAASDILQRINGHLSQNPTSCLVISDYGKGVVTSDLLLWSVKTCRERERFLAINFKPRPTVVLPPRIGLLVLNQREAIQLMDQDPYWVNPSVMGMVTMVDIASKIMDRYSPASLVITLGRSGLLLVDPMTRPIVYHVPTTEHLICEPTGAGDTVIAAYTLAKMVGATPLESAIFANRAANIVVQKPGTSSVSPEELCT